MPQSTRLVVRLVILAIVLGCAWFTKQPQKAPPAATASVPAASRAAGAAIGDASQTWGRPETLPDHFARHGQDFHARNAEDYAAQAHAFLEHAKTAGLPAKRDHDGSLRIFDRATGAFGAYNADGTTKTFFKPGSDGYFDRQPGTVVDLRTVK